jgi:hypothetical protein
MLLIFFVLPYIFKKSLGKGADAWLLPLLVLTHCTQHQLQFYNVLVICSYIH